MKRKNRSERMKRTKAQPKSQISPYPCRRCSAAAPHHHDQPDAAQIYPCTTPPPIKNCCRLEKERDRRRERRDELNQYGKKKEKKTEEEMREDSVEFRRGRAAQAKDGKRQKSPWAKIRKKGKEMSIKTLGPNLFVHPSRPN
jgi:hypothetical protein